MAARATESPEKNQPESIPLEVRIAQRAYEIYLQRGGQDGSDLADWLQAKAEIASADGQPE